jgi:hypothetical protein
MTSREYEQSVLDKHSTPGLRRNVLPPGARWGEKPKE